MALKFNAGSIREITISRFQYSSLLRHLPSGSVSFNKYGFLNENVVPYDIMPLINEYLNGGPSTFNFLRFHNGYTYSASVSRQNDIITFSFSGFSKQFNISSLPSSYRIIWLYSNYWNNEGCRVWIVAEDATLQLDTLAQETYQGNIRLMGTYSDSDTTITGAQVSTAVPNAVLSANGGVEVNPPSLFGYYPSTVMDLERPSGHLVAETGCADTGSGRQYDMARFFSANGGSPEPYDPPAPTPPTPPTSDDPNEDDPDYPSTPSTPDQDHTPSYDPVPIPNKPSDGVADAGFITMYRMTFSEFDTFASECFASSAWDAIKLLFSNPMDFLIGAALLPFIPPASISYYPKFGQFTFEHAYPRIGEQFFDVNCGDITIKKFWGSCFDYEPYTKIQIWLPYIGYRDLPTDEVMGMTINVTYRCDCLTGDCVAFVSTGVVGETGPQIPRVLAQFYGNCAVRAPFGSQSYDSAISAGIGMIGAAAGVGLGAAAGAAGLIAGGGALTAGVVSQLGASSMNNVIGMKPNISRGGAAGASAGYMSIQKPYIIRRIPRQNLPEGYIGFKGYPANITSTLGDLGGGYAEVDNIQLNNIPAMETERKEIIEYLKGGVLL